MPPAHNSFFQGWKLDPSTSTPIFPIIARPDHPLPAITPSKQSAKSKNAKRAENIEIGNAVKQKSKTEPKTRMATDPPNRARRIKIDSTKWQPKHLRASDLEIANRQTPSQINENSVKASLMGHVDWKKAGILEDSASTSSASSASSINGGPGDSGQQQHDKKFSSPSVIEEETQELKTTQPPSETELLREHSSVSATDDMLKEIEESSPSEETSLEKPNGAALQVQTLTAMFEPQESASEAGLKFGIDEVAKIESPTQSPFHWAISWTVSNSTKSWSLKSIGLQTAHPIFLGQSPKQIIKLPVNVPHFITLMKRSSFHFLYSRIKKPAALYTAFLRRRNKHF